MKPAAPVTSARSGMSSAPSMHAERTSPSWHRAAKPETAVPHFKTFSGMDLPYWREFYLLGEAEELAEKIRAKVANLGGCEQIVLNPLSWGTEQLELLAGEVLPRVARP